MYRILTEHKRNDKSYEVALLYSQDIPWNLKQILILIAKGHPQLQDYNFMVQM